MATLRKQIKRAPLKAKPRPDANAAAITAETSAQFAKTLEYLGR